MQPFGWLPDWPQWEFRSRTELPEWRESDTLEISGGGVIQSVDESWVAKLRTSLSTDQLHELEKLKHGFDERSAQSWANGADIESVWPREAREVNLDVDPSLPAGYLASQYKEALLGSSPLALFPKQVLPKLRIGLDDAAYGAMLREVFLSPADVDAKYSLENENVEFIEQVRAVDDGMRPLSLVMKQLRARDTQLQVILGLEVAGLHHSKAASASGSAESQSISALLTDLDTHFDRLCIWHAVDGGDLNDFCSSVIIPYFKARAPRKTKQLIRVFRGTLKSRSRTEKRPKTGTVKQFDPLKPTNFRPPGLLRALSLVHAPADRVEPVEQPSSSSRSLRSGSRKASRSVSHPVYRQQSRNDQVEVRFKRSRRVPPERVSKLPPVPHSPATTASTVAPMPAVPHSPDQQQPSAFIEATPTKVRTTYLESLPAPTELFDDAIGSTDSD